MEERNEFLIGSFLVVYAIILVVSPQWSFWDTCGLLWRCVVGAQWFGSSKMT